MVMSGEIEFELRRRQAHARPRRPRPRRRADRALAPQPSDSTRPSTSAWAGRAATSAATARSRDRRPVHCLVEIPKGSRNKYYRTRSSAASSSTGSCSPRSCIRPTTASSWRRARPRARRSTRWCARLGADLSGVCDPGAGDRGVPHQGRGRAGRQLLCVPHEDPNWSHMEELDDSYDQFAQRSSTSSRSTRCPRARRSRSRAGGPRFRRAVAGRSAGSVAGVQVDPREQLLAGGEAGDVLAHELGHSAAAWRPGSRRAG